jgi:hypothetical protein
LYLETSCAKSINVSNCFEELVKKILDENVFDSEHNTGKSSIELQGDENSKTSPYSCAFCR